MCGLQRACRSRHSISATSRGSASKISSVRERTGRASVEAQRKASARGLGVDEEELQRLRRVEQRQRGYHRPGEGRLPEPVVPAMRT